MCKKTISDWRPEVQIVLESKAKEFALMGYERSTPNDIWDCLYKLHWKGNPTKRLHEIVQDIYRLQSTDYMRYLTLNAYQDDDDLMASIAALTNK